MSGLLMDERYVAVFPSLVRALGSMEAAAILQQMHWLADKETGDIHVTQQELSDATGISLRTVERRVKQLRDEGYVEARRSGAYDATLTYRIDSAKLAGSSPQPAKVADSEPAKVADSSSQKVRELPHSSTENREVPDRHPARPIAPGWAPRPDFTAYLRDTYPHVPLESNVVRFVNHFYSTQTTSKSWEARLENWIITENERMKVNQQTGTDELGIPLTQRKTSRIQPLQPGDEGYVSMDDIIRSVTEPDTKEQP